MKPLCGKHVNNSTSVLQFPRTKLKPCITLRIRCSFTDDELKIDDCIIIEFTLQAWMIHSRGFSRTLLCFALRKPQINRRSAMQAFQSSVGIQQLGMSWTKVKRENKRRSLLSLPSPWPGRIAMRVI